MRIGAIFPQNKLPTDPGSLRDFALGIEALGLDHLVAYDHVVGADPKLHPEGPALRPTGARPDGWAYTHQDSFHEPLVMFGYLAALTSLELVTGVLVLPQRQTVLVAKQAAEIDVLSGGRLRLGVGLGWNGVEYQALGQSFSTRGQRIEEQVALLRRMWTEPVVTFVDAEHEVVGAGLNPLPVQRPIPVWMGTRPSGPALRRTGRIADGWLTMERPGPTLDVAWESVRREAEVAGRDPGSIGLEGRISCVDGDLGRMAAEADAWRRIGATHLSLTTLGPATLPAQAHLESARRGLRCGPELTLAEAAAEGTFGRLAPAPSIGEPLRVRAFRVLWTAQLVSNVGTWMQIVGAQWFLTTAHAAPSTVALVQTATALPFFVLGLPAGALADIMSRRRLIAGVQAAMAVVAAVLAAVTFAGHLGASGLLCATFLLGVGQTLNAPAWQAVTPELVETRLVPTAALLSAMSYNGARVAGPALGGVVIGTLGPQWVFALNAMSFGWVTVAAARRVPDRVPSGGERAWAAIRSGLTYTRRSPLMRRVLFRSFLWTIPATAVWALLPVLAHDQLQLAASGYGALLGALGVGAVGGAFVVAPLRYRVSPTVMVGITSGLYAGATIATGLFPSAIGVFVVLVLAGACWMAVMSTFMATVQIGLPIWVRARGIAAYLLVFQGCQAAGAYGWGTVADRWSVRTAFLAAGLALLASTATLLRWGMPPLVSVAE